MFDRQTQKGEEAEVEGAEIRVLIFSQDGWDGVHGLDAAS